MKRTNEAFKDEVFRRYRTEVHNRRNLRIYAVSTCLAFLLVSGFALSMFSDLSLPELIASWFDNLGETREPNELAEYFTQPAEAMSVHNITGKSKTHTCSSELTKELTSLITHISLTKLEKQPEGTDTPSDTAVYSMNVRFLTHQLYLYFHESGAMSVKQFDLDTSNPQLIGWYQIAPEDLAEVLKQFENLVGKITPAVPLSSLLEDSPVTSLTVKNTDFSYATFTVTNMNKINGLIELMDDILIRDNGQVLKDGGGSGTGITMTFSHENGSQSKINILDSISFVRPHYDISLDDKLRIAEYVAYLIRAELADIPEPDHSTFLHTNYIELTIEDRIIDDSKQDEIISYLRSKMAGLTLYREKPSYLSNTCYRLFMKQSDGKYNSIILHKEKNFLVVGIHLTQDLGYPETANVYYYQLSPQLTEELNAYFNELCDGSSKPPVTEPPTTEPPETEPPATEPPVTEPPVTEPPVTEPPVTEPPATEPPVTESTLPIMPTPSVPGLTCSPDAFDGYMDKPIKRITYRMHFEDHIPEQLISLNTSYVKDLTDRLKALKLTAITNDIFWYAPGPYVYMEFQDGSGAILMLDSIGAELYVSVYDTNGNRTVAQWYSLPESEMESLCTALKGYVPSDHAPSETCSHRNTTSQILLEATCTSEGLKVIRCTKCDDYYVLKIAILGHDYTDATCTTLRTCRRCQKTAGELLQHRYTVSQSKDATCTAEGSNTYTCTWCRDSYTEKIPMIPHDYGNAPCTASKTCLICGNVKEGTDSHSYQISDSMDATCNQEGYKVYTCTKCGDSYIEKLPQTTHVYKDAACYAPKTCTICHDTIGEALGHTYQNGVCTSCGLIQYSSEGLQFWLNADGKSYHLDSLGTCTDTEVIVPNVYMGLPVTKINNLAFYYSNVTKVVLPDTITSIERGAFCNCYYLESITLPKGLIKIGEIAFSSCEVLTEINIPDSVTTIEDRAFQYCNKLTSVIVPNSVTSLGQGIFSWSENLKSVTLPTHLTEIKNYMFQNCSSLVNVTIPDGVTSLGDRVFMGCTALKKLTLPNSIQSIGAEAFQNCTGLESITLPDKLTSLTKYMFKKCTSLKSITIPVGIVEIPAYAFAECESLQSVTIPNTVTSISSHAFTKCTGLKTIVIPNSVKVLNESVFEGCSSLESITLSNQLTSLSKNLFKKCTGLKNFAIPVGIVEIREYAFAECASLENVTISNTVEQIYDYAFTKCTSLKKITVPDTVEVLHDGVFADCTALESVTLSKTNIRINHYLFQNCTALKNINLPDTVNLIEEYAFYGSGLESITIPGKVARIGNYAFAECKSLTHVIIPGIVSTLGTEAFAGCENLQYVVIPSSVYQVGQKVFKNTPALQAIYCDLSGPTNSWSTKWLNECNATVYWKDQWEYVDGIPTAK